MSRRGGAGGEGGLFKVLPLPLQAINLHPAFVIDFPDQSIDFDIVVLNGNFGFVFAVVEGEGGDGAFESGAGYFFVLGFCRDFCHVEGYVSGFGGVVGGVLVYILFKDHFDATEDPGTKLGVFSTGPSIPNTGRNIVQEAIATFVLVFAICGLNQVPELAAGVGKLLVFGIIVAIGMSLGGLTGYALNPARDLGPRIAHAILPIKGKGSSNFKYGLIVPIFGPIIGGIVAVLLYNVIPW